MTNLAKPDLFRLDAQRTDAPSDRSAAKGGRSAGELAGQFAAMLEALHGVDPTAVISVEVPSAAAAPTVPPPIRAGPGLASLLAQGGPAPELPVDSGIPPPDPDTLIVGAGPAADVRWLAHLIAHSGTA